MTDAEAAVEEHTSGSALLTALYLDHYGSLVRLATLLLDETAAGEDVVQEAYVRLASGRRLDSLRNRDAGLAYLRTTVLNLARSSMRRRLTTAKYAPLTHGVDRLDDSVTELVDREVIVRAVRGLPRRQREAVSLRYYADLSEAQAAEVMGVSVGAVKSYTSRALDRLGETLEVV